jgi:hypothetical protein
LSSAHSNFGNDNVTHEDGGLVKVLESGRKLRSRGIGMFCHVKDCIKVSEVTGSQKLLNIWEYDTEERRPSSCRLSWAHLRPLFCFRCLPDELSRGRRHC